jgi:hypothetical protein
MQGPDRVSSVSNDEVVAHSNESLESVAASPVDIILVGATLSTSVVHHNDVDSDRDHSMPSFATVVTVNTHSKRACRPRSSTSCPTAQRARRIQALCFKLFHTPASCISDGYEAYHSAQSFPLSHSCSPSPSPSLLNRRSYHSLQVSTTSTSTALTSITPTITPA